jgi:hypothetical protein
MARIRHAHPAPDVVIVTASLTDCASGWADFRTRWADWLSQVGSPDPIYCLPEEAIACLEMSLPSGRPVVEAHSAQAERQLLALCRRINAIGFWRNRPVTFPSLSPPPSRTSFEELLRELPPAARQQSLALLDRLDGISPRLTGYVGWLRTEPMYLREVERLARLFDQLPENEKSAFPLGRALPLHNIPEGASRASSIGARFNQALREFLDRWGLTQLATWDLPCPQGPLMPNPMPAGSPATPTHGIHIFLPLHYPLQGDDDLQRDILRYQQQLAADRGLNPSMAGLPHFAVYGQILRLIHLEKIIVQRYGQSPRPKAFMTRVEQAIGDVLRCSEDHVKKLRKGVSLCLRGRRTAVRWLRSARR